MLGQRGLAVPGTAVEHVSIIRIVQLIMVQM